MKQWQWQCAALRQHSRGVAGRNTVERATGARTGRMSCLTRPRASIRGQWMHEAIREFSWRVAAVIALATLACGGSSRSAGGQAPSAAPPPAAAPAASPGANVSGRACATPDDSTGTSISGTFRARPDLLYAAGSAALRELGYAVLETVPPRELITAPSYSWPRGSD